MVFENIFIAVFISLNILSSQILIFLLIPFDIHLYKPKSITGRLQLSAWLVFPDPRAYPAHTQGKSKGWES